MPPAIRVMHFADTHFGVETYGRLDPATGLNTRLLDFRRSLEGAIDEAIERGVHLAVFAGDAYKGRDPSQTHQREFAGCIRRLTDRGIPVAMLTGNHDVPGIRGRAHSVEIYRTLGVSNVHVFGRPEARVVETPGGPVQIVALPYLMKGFLLAREEFLGKTADETRQMMEARYQSYLDGAVAEMQPGLPTILLGHFWVRSARLSAWQQSYMNVNEPQVPLAMLTRPEFDYVALGHIHRHQDLNRHASPPVVYSGSPDRIDFGERDETKGWVLVDLEKGATRYEFVPTPDARPFIELDVDADTDTPTETIVAAIGQRPLRDAIVRLTYRLPADKLPLVREKEIREALAPAFMVVAVRRDVLRDQAARSRILTETLDPRTALQHFFSQQGKTTERQAELMAYAERLFEELRRQRGEVSA